MRKKWKLFLPSTLPVLEAALRVGLGGEARDPTGGQALDREGRARELRGGGGERGQHRGGERCPPRRVGWGR